MQLSAFHPMLWVLGSSVLLSGCSRPADPITTANFPVPTGKSEKIRLLFRGLPVDSDQTYRNLPDRERFVWDIWWLYSEYTNGGLEQVFWNHTGNHVRETVEALEAIGAQTTATTLTEASATFGREGPSAEQETRREQMRQLRSAHPRPLDRLDGQMFKDDVFGLLLQYWTQQETAAGGRCSFGENKRKVLNIVLGLPVEKATDYYGLSETQRIAWDICWLDVLHNGKGFDTYYIPGVADHAVRTQHALKAIGADMTATLLQKWCSGFPGGSPSADPVVHSQEVLTALKTHQGTFPGMELREGVCRFQGAEEDLFSLLLPYWAAHE